MDALCDFVDSGFSIISEICEIILNVVFGKNVQFEYWFQNFVNTCYSVQNQTQVTELNDIII